VLYPYYYRFRYTYVITHFLPSIFVALKLPTGSSKNWTHPVLGLQGKVEGSSPFGTHLFSASLRGKISRDEMLSPQFRSLLSDAHRPMLFQMMFCRFSPNEQLAARSETRACNRGSHRWPTQEHLAASPTPEAAIRTSGPGAWILQRIPVIRG
jgi:hypothetical protein